MDEGILVTYKEQAKFDKYYTLPSKERAKIDDVVSMFIKELTTLKGSNVFDKEYGTTFIEDISSQVNFYKVEYFLKNKYKELYDKYGIVRVDVTDVSFNTSNGFLEVRMKIIFKEYALEHYTSFLYNGIYTTNTIIEMD
jgi:hypothetical protein